MRRGRLIGIVGVLLLALAACGGGATPETGGAAPTVAATPAAGATSPASSAAPASSGAVASAAPATTPATGGATGTATRAAAGTAVATAPRASATATSAAARYTIAQPNSKATYKVSETFFNQGNRINLAEGTTTDIVGDLFIDKTKPSASRIGTVTVNISKLESDSEQRDDQIRQRWLESTKYPTATFVPKRLEGLPDTPYTDGTDLTFKIIGDLTVRTVTKEVTFNATGKIVGDLFTGTATTQFNMTDFGFDPPSILGILKAENGVELVLTIEAKRAP